MVIVVDVGKVVMVHLETLHYGDIYTRGSLRQKAPRINNTERM
jgi:hypothetical protein